MPSSARFVGPETWFERRDEIKTIIVNHLKTGTTRQWLAKLEPADYWCAEVLNLHQLLQHDGFKTLEMIQTVSRKNGTEIQTTRCPIRIDGEKLFSEKGAPALGEDNNWIQQQFSLNEDAVVLESNKLDRVLA